MEANAHGKATAAKIAAHTAPKTGTAKPCRGDAPGQAANVPAVYHCKRCGQTWTARAKGTPKQCPHCNSPNWNAAAASCLCGLCGQIWTARATDTPKQCPRCNSSNWANNWRAIVMQDKPLRAFRAQNQSMADIIERDWRKSLKSKRKERTERRKAKRRAEREAKRHA